MSKIWFLPILVLPLALLTGGCGEESTQAADNGPIHVVATTSIIAIRSFVRKLAA